MNRVVQIRLRNVDPVPATLRADPMVNAPQDQTEINLGQLFQHYYFDSYGPSAPAPDPSRFEYLDLVAAHPEFRLLARFKDASLVKRRAISTELGQAFCRLSLHTHFGIRYFAHMSDVLGKPTHAAFSGLRVRRVQPGDVPDYLCARQVTRPRIAESKGRLSSVSFENAEFQAWRNQFARIEASAPETGRLRLKGFIVGTRFVTEESRESTKTTVFVEDPETAGEVSGDREGGPIGRVVASLHYSRVLLKLDLLAMASSLENGFPLARELSYRIPEWTCFTSPLQGRRFIGGFYATQSGHLPQFENGAWVLSPFLGRGHASFVGLESSVAKHVALAARGDWAQLDDIPEMVPEGSWSSEVSWLPDGTTIAPLEYFRPTGTLVL